MTIIALYRILRDLRVRIDCLRCAWALDWLAWLRAANDQNGVIYREDWTR